MDSQGLPFSGFAMPDATAKLDDFFGAHFQLSVRA